MDAEDILEEEYEEASDEAENEYSYFNDPSSTQPSSGPPSTPNSCASSPPINSEEPISPQRNIFPNILSQNGNSQMFSYGKPYAPKRGPGRPRKEGIPGIRSIKDGRIYIKRFRGGIGKITSKKRMYGKDERYSVQSSSQDRLYTILPKSPIDISSSLDISLDGNDRNMQIESIPYFPEKWPGKLCALCNLGERSQLGQGEMLRLQINENEQNLYLDVAYEDKDMSLGDVSSSSASFPQLSNRRQKGLSKCKNPVNNVDYVDELEKIGYFEAVDFSNVHDGNFYYVHRLCATWSFGVLRQPSGALDKISSVISQSLRRKCSFCNHYGASVACKMSCPKFFHLPCVSASGGFQIIQNYVSFCKEHINQVPLIYTDDINCRSCSGLGDVSNLVMCSICGDHYHGTCIGLPQLPGVRAGWQCKSCQRCQICRLPDANEGRSLSCEQCHKIYHAHCLRPVMSSIPKYGWKCRRCRICSDCGSRTPGAGASSRWHAHYTVCDSCYQQRNKGFSCPICHRAYRAAAYREMVKCSWCNKFVHSTCDSEADLSVYHSRKESNPDYDYMCPPCKTLVQNGRLPQSLVRRNYQIDEEGIPNIQENITVDDVEGENPERNTDYGLGKGKPYLGAKIIKKNAGLPFVQYARNKGKLSFQKRSRMSEFGRKRGPKAKMRSIFGVPGIGLQRPIADASNAKNDDEPGMENRIVLCSAKDKFILTQDICVMCGAIGTDQEGCLIACTQCGQCYHPYCVNVKVTKVILKKGWRCLDCTVCEGCGEKNDEARLILCDECDISFHIYCMDPPLDFVPQGNWKCKWCAVCQKCGANNPGKNCLWKNSYSECGPCASQTSCAVCNEMYIENELIIQCINCERWLHGKCDSIRNEEDAEKCDEGGYVCILCRPKDSLPTHLVPHRKVPSVNYMSNNNVTNLMDDQTDASISQSLEGSHYLDGVCLSEHGLSLIKSLQMEYIRKKRKKLTSELNVNNKDAAILAAIESVVAGSGIENAIEDLKIEPLDPKEEAEIYKDGMVWERSDASPPEGFTLCTNEQGVVVLRKKRQRNLQKLGIGGFNVRNRTFKKDWFFRDDIEEQMEYNGLSTGNNENEKRKKPLRKKQKNKLTETYPIYLQEAFFGKNLLDTHKSILESESSDDDTRSSVSDDKIIKLSPEELKILDDMKNEQNMFCDIVKENKEGGKDIQRNDLKSYAANNTSNESSIKSAISAELLETELTESSAKENASLNSKPSPLGVIGKTDNATTEKMVLDEILPTNFNLEPIEIDSKDVEKMFQEVAEEEVKKHHISNSAESLEPIIITPNPKDVRFTTSQHSAFCTTRKGIEPSQSIQPLVNQNIGGLSDKISKNSIVTYASNMSQSTWSEASPKSRQSLDFSSTSTEDTLISTVSNQSNCSQRSSERMRRDEDLGEMATISAVLYANTNHPELKHDYPNWTDRCKQIYKRWRALSNEKKAPFLQQARDNRSALRMKKVQQDQEKVSTQQKALREQEQERQWKQLQAMRAKEQQMQQLNNQSSRDGSSNASNNNSNLIIEKSIVSEKNADFQTLSNSPCTGDKIKEKMCVSQINTTQSSSISDTSVVSRIIDGQNQCGTKPETNKQLRDLLQKKDDDDSVKQGGTITSVKSNQLPTDWSPSGTLSPNQNNMPDTTFREPFPVSHLGKNTKSTCGQSNCRPTTPVTTRNLIVKQNLSNKNSFDMGKKQKRLKDQSNLESEVLSNNEMKKAVQNKNKLKDDSKVSENTNIPEIIPNELEKLEQEENVTITEVEGVGDILGGIGEDDDDELLNSLTAEMGVDFNILEYADPELDALTDCSNQNLLDKLDLDEGDAEEKSKKSVGDMNNKTYISEEKGIVGGNTSTILPLNAGMGIKKEKDATIRTQPGKQFIHTQGNNSCVASEEPVNVIKPIDVPKSVSFAKFNVISPNALCKIPRGSLPPPPPPYPGPPPPYPATTKNLRHGQEQPPLLLEDLLEQEKREQQQQLSSLAENKQMSMNISYTKSDSLAQNVSLVLQSSWRKSATENNQSGGTVDFNTTMTKRQGSPLFAPKIQLPPPLPPENVITENDRNMQLNYEQWLNSTNAILSSQLKYYEDEIFKLRKIRKSLNSKQRLMKKSGNELSTQDIMEFTKITSEQSVMQKHLEAIRKQCRQHALLIQDYKAKHSMKLQIVANMPSPGQITSASPMVSPSNSSQSSLLMQTTPSPMGSHILQSTRSPLQSPSSLISHSPSAISQSPVHQSNSNVSPYHNTQTSPRIGTPHSQIDENSFSPSGTIPSPSSISGRHASPSPRITSPQHRTSNSQLSLRMSSSPGHAFASVSNTQNQKFNNVQSSQDRSRIQMGIQQNITTSDIQATVTSTNQINNFNKTTDILQAHRPSHFFHQRHVIQRQSSTKSHSPSPKHKIPSSPSSPHVHYQIQQNLNRRNTNETQGESYQQEDQQEQISQCGENNSINSPQDTIIFSRNSNITNPGNSCNNTNSGGGGLSNICGSYLPASGFALKAGRIKLGLLGGSPMWNLSSVKNKFSAENQHKQHIEGETSSECSRSLSEVSNSLTIIKSNNSNNTKLSIHPSPQNSNNQNTNNRNILNEPLSLKSPHCIDSKSDVEVNSIVVIDDSPSEKQRIMDYDDFQDKGFVTTEISLNSAAQNLTDGDDIAVIESFASSELADIVSSPLESEGAEEYVLFSSDVVDYADSDDSMKTMPISQKSEDVHLKTDNNVDQTLSSTPKNIEQRLDDEKTSDSGSGDVDKVTTQDNAKSPESKNFATEEDFEAMIDCRQTKKKGEDKMFESNSAKINIDISKSSIPCSSTTTSVLSNSRIPLNSVTCGIITGINTPTTTSPTVVMAPKKIVTDVTQATAKVSIGNTTISVPLLKTMTLNSPHILPSEKSNKISTNVSLSKQPTILNVRGQKLNPGTIVSLSSLQLKPTSNTKIVQATVVGKKLQLPQTALEGVTNVKHNVIHSFNYPKLSSLTVLHDMALPNKIFEDESVSPENPLDQDEMSESSHILDCQISQSCSESVVDENKDKSANNSTEMLENMSTEDRKEGTHGTIEKEVINVSSRQMPVISQLSPLSKPAEMTTNMANVSQQLRTIMSSINSSSIQVDKVKDDKADNTVSTKIGLLQNVSKKDNEVDKSSVQASNTFERNSSSPSVSRKSSSPNKFENTYLKERTSEADKISLITSTSSYVKVSSPNIIVSSITQSQKDNTQITEVEKKSSSSILLPHLKRSKSTDDGIERDAPAQIIGTKRYSLELLSIKNDASDNNDGKLSDSSNVTTKVKEASNSSCKRSGISSQHTKSDESQNVLLKQLLQNSTTSNTSNVTPPIITGRKVPGLRAPSLGVVSSLEAQLARPVIPPVPTNPSPLLQNSQHQLTTQTDKSSKETDEGKKPNQIISMETSFISNPIHKNLQLFNEKTEKSNNNQDNNSESSLSSIDKKTVNGRKLSNDFSNRITTIQKDNDLPYKSSYVEEGKCGDDLSDTLKKSTANVQLSGNNFDSLDEVEPKDDKARAADSDANNDLKKKKKREYQKNRRQMLNKEIMYSKKRSRKLSKLDEDYDNFIDNLMVQLRQMQPLQVLEPLLSRNYIVCPPYGVGNKENSATEGLHGSYGNAYSAGITDFYNIKPFGYLDAIPEEQPTPIHNGFYDQEFPPIKFETDTDQITKMENMFKDRDIDTPESIVTSSSPECVVWDAALSFPGLRVIKENNENDCFDRMSPEIPLVVPVPIKLQAGLDLTLDRNQSEWNKENNSSGEWKKRLGQQVFPSKDANVTVTLTLTSTAAEDIMGVLRDLANILHIPPPTSYQIVERTMTPPSQKLGLYRTRGRDGKEGNPIDIQTILNGTAKFCRHCDVVILNTIIRAKATEFPLLASNELMNNNDDLYFCSKTCYKQFKWRPTNIIEENMSSTRSGFSFVSDSLHLDSGTKQEPPDVILNKFSNYSENNIEMLGKSSFSSDEAIERNNETQRRSVCYRYFSKSCFATPVKTKKMSEKEITEMLFKMNITVAPNNKAIEDTRQCIFCGQTGDGVADGPSRLLNFDVDKWVHLNCALWSDGVYETVNGGLMNLESALQSSLYQTCILCHQLGATIKCFKNRCSNIYHLTCAMKEKCVFYKNKTTHCQAHAPKNEKDNELTTLSVQRRVYVERDESRQVAAVMHHSELTNLLRVGSLTFLSIGQLLPHQLQAFHTPNYIYPIGYKIIRFYWSMRRPNKRCRYICSIADVSGRPEFRILVQEPMEEDIELRDSSPKAVWQRILEPIAALRKDCELVQLFPKYITGEDLFGLTEPAVVRILESLPGIETLTDYRFKYGRNPLLELPLAINPSGAARTEPKQKQSVGWRKPHTQRSGSISQRLPLTPTTSIAGEVACPYSKQFVHSKSSQYKKMKQEWRNNVYLARSKIQGLGLYAARDLEKHTMVIEYIGEVIRTEVSEIREKQYEARNRGIYMFRLDEDRVVDATLCGGLARYINHSCNPNCVTEIVEVDREYRIIIFAKRRINRGEELSYDYKFDIEDDAHKISCMCGAPNCRKWMN